MSETRATEVIFRARGLTKVYRMGDVEVRALRGIDLELFQGEFVVMLGPSGSGKSTLLNILGGLGYADCGRSLVSRRRLKPRRRCPPDPFPPRACRLCLPVL